LSDYEPEDVYNMVEVGWYFGACPNKTFSTREGEGSEVTEENVILALVVNSTGTELKFSGGSHPLTFHNHVR
jgi:hypothetical protein